MNVEVEAKINPEVHKAILDGMDLARDKGFLMAVAVIAQKRAEAENRIKDITVKGSENNPREMALYGRAVSDTFRVIMDELAPMVDHLDEYRITDEGKVVKK